MKTMVRVIRKFTTLEILILLYAILKICGA